MSYRPITDFWFLTRCKYKGGVKRYGGYLGGFPERARRLIGCSINEPLLHVCGGLAKLYPYAGGFGPFDETLDNDKSVNPDYCEDAEGMLPVWSKSCKADWGGMLIDPPYSEEDAKRYPFSTYPSPNKLVGNAINAVGIGRKVGIIHYVVPRCPKNARFVACVGIVCGFGNRIRCFSVFEKMSDK